MNDGANATLDNMNKAKMFRGTANRLKPGDIIVIDGQAPHQAQSVRVRGPMMTVTTVQGTILRLKSGDVVTIYETRD